jgi:beta-glucosidase
VRYGEGIYVGYRYAEKVRNTRFFTFGFGLSYARFEAGPLRLDKTELGPGGTLRPRSRSPTPALAPDRPSLSSM